MARLEDLTTGTRVTAPGSATVESAQRIGEQGVRVIYRDADGGLGERFVYRDDELTPVRAEVGHSRSRPDHQRPASHARASVDRQNGGRADSGLVRPDRHRDSSAVGALSAREARGSTERRQRTRPDPPEGVKR